MHKNTNNSDININESNTSNSRMKDGHLMVRLAAFAVAALESSDLSEDQRMVAFLDVKHCSVSNVQIP